MADRELPENGEALIESCPLCKSPFDEAQEIGAVVECQGKCGWVFMLKDMRESSAFLKTKKKKEPSE